MADPHPKIVIDLERLKRLSSNLEHRNFTAELEPTMETLQSKHYDQTDYSPRSPNVGRRRSIAGAVLQMPPQSATPPSKMTVFQIDLPDTSQKSFLPQISPRGGRPGSSSASNSPRRVTSIPKGDQLNTLPLPTTPRSRSGSANSDTRERLVMIEKEQAERAEKISALAKESASTDSLSSLTRSSLIGESKSKTEGVLSDEFSDTVVSSNDVLRAESSGTIARQSSQPVVPITPKPGYLANRRGSLPLNAQSNMPKSPRFDRRPRLGSTPVKPQVPIEVDEPTEERFKSVSQPTTPRTGSSSKFRRRSIVSTLACPEDNTKAARSMETLEKSSDSEEEKNEKPSGANGIHGAKSDSAINEEDPKDEAIGRLEKLLNKVTGLERFKAVAHSVQQIASAALHVREHMGVEPEEKKEEAEGATAIRSSLADVVLTLTKKKERKNFRKFKSEACMTSEGLQEEENENEVSASQDMTQSECNSESVTPRGASAWEEDEERERKETERRNLERELRLLAQKNRRKAADLYSKLNEYARKHRPSLLDFPLVPPDLSPDELKREKPEKLNLLSIEYLARSLQLSPDDQHRYMELFVQLDTKGDQTVTVAQMVWAAQQLDKTKILSDSVVNYFLTLFEADAQARFSFDVFCSVLTFSVYTTAMDDDTLAALDCTHRSVTKDTVAKLKEWFIHHAPAPKARGLIPTETMRAELLKNFPTMPETDAHRLVHRMGKRSPPGYVSYCAFLVYCPVLFDRCLVHEQEKDVNPSVSMQRNIVSQSLMHLEK
eukprot:Colp12_sorted_trinity150504_noHs@34941